MSNKSLFYDAVYLHKAIILRLIASIQQPAWTAWAQKRMSTSRKEQVVTVRRIQALSPLYRLPQSSHRLDLGALRSAPCCLSDAMLTRGERRRQRQWVGAENWRVQQCAKPHLPLQLSKATHQLEESKVQRKAVCLWVMMEWWWKKSTAASSSAKEKGPPWLGESMVT